ncbi:MAG: ATP-dependent DNA ligase [Thermoprotei archaeon]|nr:MAG: ATP-dependent DNA ligase [Thermoprotei archaeon]
MLYSTLVDAYENLERTTKRLEMTEILVSLFKKVPVDLIDKVVYLTQGKLYPDYMGVELGIAEKLAMRSIAEASATQVKVVEDELKRVGDIGKAAENILSKRKAVSLLLFMGAEHKPQPLTVLRVYETLDKIAKASGEGAQETKVALLTALLKDATPKEARYLVRTVTGKLRLGVADMTILDALAISFCGGKEARPFIERAYNLSSDLGFVAKVAATEGLEGIKRFKITIGRPIRPMLAERLATPEEILAKLGGKCIAEYKYDGERIQAHKQGDKVMLFSRRLENITHHYPDACDLLREHLKAKEAIIECECVAIDPDTGELRPFQELMHRRRKYGVEEAMKLFPVSLFLFDVLYVDGLDLTLKPYPERREYLMKIVEEAERIKIAEYKFIDSPEELEKFFEEAVANGCEGVICKSLTANSIYQAGARGWLWIKLKRSYQSKMQDTVDLVPVGAFYGRGRRAGTYGALLLAAYDPETDTFKTVCKCGSGFSDEELAKLPELFKPYIISHQHPRVDSRAKPDVWFVPALVAEVLGDEITLSPMATAAMGAIKEGAGLSIRFPRFMRWRPDKRPEDATTVNELLNMYKSQLKRIEAEEEQLEKY